MSKKPRRKTSYVDRKKESPAAKRAGTPRSAPKKSPLPGRARKPSPTKSHTNAKQSPRGTGTRIREIRPWTVWLITRKTNDDQYLLRPDELVGWILLYLLLMKIRRYGLQLHGFVVMSNHIHLVVTDTRGTLPDFAREFFGESGRALQLALGTTRLIWGGKRYVATELLDHDAAERAIAYCYTNPSKAGMTLPKDWPGLTSARFRFGDTLTARRPDLYFGANREEVVEGVLAPLPRVVGETVCDEGNDGSDCERFEAECDRLQARIDVLVESKLQGILAERKAAGKSGFAGREAALKVSRLTRTSNRKRGITPRFMSRDRERRVAAMSRHKAFLADYEDARERYIEGEQGVWFPHGTYGYRKQLRVNVRGGAVA